MDAGVIVFIKSEFDCLDIEQVTRAELKTAMDTDDAFGRLDEAIVNVKYVEKSELELSEVKDVANGNDGADKDDGVDSIPIYAWVLVGLGSILFVMTLGLIYKNVHHFRSKKADSQSSDHSSWSSCIERESSDKHEEEESNSRCHCDDWRNSHVSFCGVDE